MKDKKQYWAFVSYSSKDKRWGQWLHRRLENYPIPKEFQGSELFDGAVLGKNLRPVFRDRDELSGSSNLGESIRAALEASRFLVVLCSKNSAQSKWVNKEIEDFQAMGKGARILALILDGEPNAENPEEECFPPALRYPAEPIAGDLRKEGDGKERGFLKILAGIAQVGFDEIFDRHKRAKRLRWIIRSVLAMSLLAMIVITAQYAVSQRAQRRVQELEAARQKAIAEEKAAEARREMERATVANQEASAQRELAEQKEREKRAQHQAGLLREAETLWLEKAQEAKRSGDYPGSVLLAARGLGFAGYGVEEVATENHAQFQESHPILFNPAKHPGLERRLREVIDGAKKPLLPYWVSLVDEERSHVLTVAFSPDGKHLACGTDKNQVVVYNLSTGEVLGRLRGKDMTHGVSTIAFSPNGRHMAFAAENRTIVLWNTVTKKPDALLRGHAGKINSLAFHPLGNRLASAGEVDFAAPSDDSVRIWNLSNARCERVIAAGGVNALAYSVNGEQLVCGGACVDVYVSDTGARVHRLNGGSIEIYGVAVSPDGSKVAGGGGISISSTTGEPGRCVTVWDLATGEEIGKVQGPTKRVTDMQFAMNSQNLIVSFDEGKIRIYDASTGETRASLLNSLQKVNSLDISPDGRSLACVGSDGAVRLWDITDSKEMGTPQLKDLAIEKIALLRGKGLIAYFTVRELAIQNLYTGQLKQRRDFEGDYRFFRRTQVVAFDRSGTRMAMGSSSGEIALWDVETCSVQRKFNGHFGEITALAFSDDGKSLASAGDDLTLKRWNTGSGCLISEVSGLASPLRTLLFCPDGSALASISLPMDKVQIWSVTPFERKKVFGVLGSYEALAFSPDGLTIAMEGKDHNIDLWDVESGEMKLSLTGMTEGVKEILFCPDAKTIIACGYDHTIRVWKISAAKHAKPVVTYQGHKSSVNSIALDEAATVAVSGGEDRSIRLWDIGAVPRLDLARYVCDGWYNFSANAAQIFPKEPQKVGFLNVPSWSHIGIMQKSDTPLDLNLRLYRHYLRSEACSGAIALLGEPMKDAPDALALTRQIARMWQMSGSKGGAKMLFSRLRASQWGREHLNSQLSIIRLDLEESEKRSLQEMCIEGE